jgi:hypothetical protein
MFDIVLKEPSLIECLLTYKKDDKYIHRICNLGKNLLVKEMSKFMTEISDIKFLIIEYNTKDSNPIALELNKGDYLINNEILSCVFVKRMLEYQVAYHKFDKNYVLSLMDNNLKTVDLKYGQYIVMHKTYYTIMDDDGVVENICSKKDDTIRNITNETIYDLYNAKQ